MKPSVLWQWYCNRVAHNLKCPEALPTSSPFDSSTVELRDRLYVSFVLYVFPFSFLALIPGLTMSLINGKHVIAMSGPFAVGLVGCGALFPGLSKAVRGGMLLTALYGIAMVLIWRLNAFGSGLLYFMSIAVFIAITIRGPAAYVSIFVSFLLCLLPICDSFTFGERIAVGSSLLFLGSVVCLCVQRILSWLELSNDRLSRANAELKEIVFATSHHLREPVKRLTCACSMLGSNTGHSQDDFETATILAMIKDSSTQLLAQLDSLRTLASVHDRESKIEPVDLNELIHATVDRLQRAGHEIDSHIDRLPIVTGDRHWLGYLFELLYQNAIELGAVPLSVRVEKEDSSDRSAIVLFRSSIASRAIDVERLLLPFARSGPSSGAGMGLAICRKIAEAHGGDLVAVQTEPEQLLLRLKLANSPHREGQPRRKAAVQA